MYDINIIIGRPCSAPDASLAGCDIEPCDMCAAGGPEYAPVISIKPDLASRYAPPDASPMDELVLSRHVDADGLPAWHVDSRRGTAYRWRHWIRYAIGGQWSIRRRCWIVRDWTSLSRYAYDPMSRYVPNARPVDAYVARAEERQRWTEDDYADVIAGTMNDFYF